MKRILKILLVLLILTAVGIQFVPVDRTNAGVETDLGAPPEVDAILRRSCYDCHSNETRWPWYSHVAPVSWLVEEDVRHGREHLNFSTWNRYDTKKRNHLKHEIWEEVEEGKMPLENYLRMHGDAKLGEADLKILRAWAEEQEK
jgi:hypothetical protein